MVDGTTRQLTDTFSPEAKIMLIWLWFSVLESHDLGEGDRNMYSGRRRASWPRWAAEEDGKYGLIWSPLGKVVLHSLTNGGSSARSSI